MKAATPWNEGRLNSFTERHRLLFGQMYEDAAIEQRAFQRKGRIFCIASAGNTAIWLSHGHKVVACDINPMQLAYAERRANGRPPETGDAERIMCIMRTFKPLIGWREGVVREFLALSNIHEQLLFWSKNLDTTRFRIAFDAFMSRLMLGVMYSRPLLSSLPLKFGTALRKRLDRGLAHHPNSTNPYMRALLLGECLSEPPAIAANIQFIHGDAAAVLEACDPASFEGFALSNVLDGATLQYRERLAQAVRHAATHDAVVVLRSFAEPSSTNDTNHPERDRTMLWGMVDIRNVHTCEAG